MTLTLVPVTIAEDRRIAEHDRRQAGSPQRIVRATVALSAAVLDFLVVCERVRVQVAR